MLAKNFQHKSQNSVILAILLLLLNIYVAFANDEIIGQDLADLNVNYSEIKNLDYYLLMDQDTGEILLQKNIDEKVAPSSMTKLMTAYVIFKEIEKGNLKLFNHCIIGKDAWRKTGSTMFLNHGDIVSIDKLLTGLLVVSGNDSAVALAQTASGSVKSFAKLMNDTAKEIKMFNSRFRNPHGLNERNHYVTLRDLGTLAKRLAKDFPEYMHYFSKKEFTYGNIVQRNRNPLIKDEYEGATGMKTGYTSDGGYGVVGTASRNGRNLIAVTNNTITPGQRKRAIFDLMDYGFDNFEKIEIFTEGDIVASANVWLGEVEKVKLVTNKDIAITIPKDQNIDNISFEVIYKNPIFTPIKKNQEIAKLEIKIIDKTIQEIPLYAQDAIKKAGYFKRMWRVLEYKINNFLK